MTLLLFLNDDVTTFMGIPRKLRTRWKRIRRCCVIIIINMRSCLQEAPVADICKQRASERWGERKIETLKAVLWVGGCCRGEAGTQEVKQEVSHADINYTRNEIPCQTFKATHGMGLDGRKFVFFVIASFDGFIGFIYAHKITPTRWRWTILREMWSI